MPQTKYRPRLVIECTQNQKNIISANIEHGMQRKFFEGIIEDITQLLEEFGYVFVLYTLERRFSYRAALEEYANSRPTDPSSN